MLLLQAHALGADEQPAPPLEIPNRENRRCVYTVRSIDTSPMLLLHLALVRDELYTRAASHAVQTPKMNSDRE